jgi:hypothetical protein
MPQAGRDYKRRFRDGFDPTPAWAIPSSIAISPSSARSYQTNVEPWRPQ